MKFWESKTLAEMSIQEWESLCDNCGKCCLHKLEDEETGDLAFTRVVCDLIDLESCRCSRYSERCTLVPDCLDLKQHDFAAYNWLPDTCAYRLLIDGKPLFDWHPLVSGNPDSVREAGVCISAYAIKESLVDDMEDHIIGWL
ncbi:MAG: YcgN family cysteine cluster protein [Methylococcales bacterium]|nr:YcgN family cysteine cluster protein [Methylococcales bacterium]